MLVARERGYSDIVELIKRALARAAAMGFRFQLGVETEFCVFRDTPEGGFAPPSERDRLDKPAYDVRTLLDGPEFRRDFVVAIEGYGEGRVSILVA